MTEHENRMSQVGEHLTLTQLVNAGRDRLGEYERALIDSGAGEGVTVHRNSTAYGSLGLRSRVLIDVSSVVTETRFLGQTIKTPVMLAPVGPVALFDRRGARAVVEAADSFGTVAFLGMSSSPAFGEAVSDAGKRHILQVYVGGDRGWISELVRRLEEIECLGICVTVDNPVPARRDRMIEMGADWKSEWSGGFPNLMGLGRDRASQAAFDWADLEWLVGETRLPVILKGVMDSGDARRAVELGVGAVYVSNHGGRILDHGLATIDVLPEIADSVRTGAALLVDGGIGRGTDVCKALALGADLVLIGRLQCWGLAAGGAHGVRRALELLDLELSTTMASMGVASIQELTRSHVRAVLA